MQLIRIFRLGSAVAAISLSAASITQAASNDGLIISRALYDGECIDYPKSSPEDSGGPESVATAVGLMVAKELVPVGISLISDWFEAYEDSLKGVDSASSVDAFYCKMANSDDYYGLRPQIIYRRTTARTDQNQENILIELKTDLDHIVTNYQNPTGVFTLTPASLTYNTPIARRGSNKDLAITYIFDFYDGGATPTTVTVGPVVLKNIKAGVTYNDLSSQMGPTLGGSLPRFTPIVRQTIHAPSRLIFETPFKLSIQVAETSAGRGEELAAAISKSIATSLEKNKEDISTAILDRLFDQDEEETEGAED